jgi:hypothetical protein
MENNIGIEHELIYQIKKASSVNQLINIKQQTAFSYIHDILSVRQYNRIVKCIKIKLNNILK